jgi:alkylresorcinol/alkylpyrone synthase
MGRHPRLVALVTGTPPHIVKQTDAQQFVSRMFADVLGPERDRLLAVFDHGQIETRHACMPLEWFGSDHDFTERNRLYVENAERLGAEVIGRALDQVGFSAGDVDHLVFVSSTGLATPSLDARLANRLGLRSDVRRTPVWGLGCAGGAAGLARARDFALAAPRSRVMLVALELCSLAFQRNDLSKRNLVAASLFADGAAAALVLGSEAPAPPRRARRAVELVAASSTLWPDTLDVMGWDVRGDGLRVIFSRDIPSIVRERVRESLDAFLATQGLGLDGLGQIVAHPGGLKVLAAYAETLGRPLEAFRHARDVLRENGNMSSPTCLFVLERFLAADEIGDGSNAVLTALGPGFAAEHVLLRGAEG